ncbi:uncharacterized protein LOC143254509 [Tachypleus tridentatus]|uniref:uncharacterized protein LOC143254509 n=1 Tax=Tachypleus tridentatus TaxID=6853 RepID=UPI003FD44507
MLQVQVFKQSITTAETDDYQSPIYQTFRTLTCVARLGGASFLLGLQKNSPKYLHVKRFSWLSLYGAIIWLLLLGCLVSSMYLHICFKPPNLNTFLYYVGLSSIFFVFVSASASIAVMFYKAPSFITILNEYLDLELKVGFFRRSQNNVNLLLKIFIIVLSVSIVFMAAFHISLAFLQDQNFSHIHDQYFPTNISRFLFYIISLIAWVVGGIFWGEIYVVYAIYFALISNGLFESLNAQVRNITRTGHSVCLPDIEHLRQIHLRLVKIMEKTDKLLSPGILLFFVTRLYFCCFCGALLIKEDIQLEYKAGISLLLLRSVVIMCLTCLICEALTRKTHTFYEIMSEMSSNDLPQELAQQVTLSAIVRPKRQISFTGSQFFTINQQLMITILGTILTYTVILIQTTS